MEEREGDETNRKIKLNMKVSDAVKQGEGVRKRRGEKLIKRKADLQIHSILQIIINNSDFYSYDRQELKLSFPPE